MQSIGLVNIQWIKCIIQKQQKCIAKLEKKIIWKKKPLSHHSNTPAKKILSQHNNKSNQYFSLYKMKRKKPQTTSQMYISSPKPIVLFDTSVCPFQYNFTLGILALRQSGSGIWSNGFDGIFSTMEIIILIEMSSL